MRSLLVLSFVAVAFFAKGEALKCYACISSSKACMDAFDKTGAGVREVVCPEVPNLTYYCGKVNSELTNGTTLITRYCFPQAPVRQAVERASDVSIVSETVYYCKDDLCNGVSATSATLSTLIVLVVPFVFAKYH